MRSNVRRMSEPVLLVARSNAASLLKPGDETLGTCELRSDGDEETLNAVRLVPDEVEATA